MPEISNEKYQHVGSGTAILAKKGIITQITKKFFNNEKKSLILIQCNKEDPINNKIMIGNI